MIKKLLDNMEEQHGIEILFACEAGSRAWGFESKDSDFDIRFIYRRPKDHYLSLNIEHKRDVLENVSFGVEGQEPNETLEKYDIVGWDIRKALKHDIVGWDIRKALKLMLKGNPPLYEWLHSTRIYRDKLGIDFLILSQDFYSRKAVIHHYRGMAYSTYVKHLHKYFQGHRVSYKKYLYVIRPLLCVEFVKRFEGVPPVRLESLLRMAHKLDIPDNVVTCTRGLIHHKRTREDFEGIRIEPLDEFIEQRINETEVSFKPHVGNPEKLEKFFRVVLERSSNEFVC